MGLDFRGTLTAFDASLEEWLPIPDLLIGRAERNETWFPDNASAIPFLTPSMCSKRITKLMSNLPKQASDLPGAHKMKFHCARSEEAFGSLFCLLVLLKNIGQQI